MLVSQRDAKLAFNQNQGLWATTLLLRADHSVDELYDHSRGKMGISRYRSLTPGKDLLRGSSNEDASSLFALKFGLKA